MSTTTTECGICYQVTDLVQYHPVSSQYQGEPHSFCADCTSRLRSTRSPCPLCRVRAPHGMEAIPRPPPLVIPPRTVPLEGPIRLRVPEVLSRAVNQGWFSNQESYPDNLRPDNLRHISEFFENSAQPQEVLVERWVHLVYHYRQLLQVLLHTSERNIERLKLATSYFTMRMELMITRDSLYIALHRAQRHPPALDRREIIRTFCCLTLIVEMFFGSRLERTTDVIGVDVPAVPEPAAPAAQAVRSSRERAYDLLNDLVSNRASPDEILVAARFYAEISRVAP